MKNRLILILGVVFVLMLGVQGTTYYDRYQSRYGLQFQANLEVCRVVAQTFSALVNDIFRQELAMGKTLHSLQTLVPEEVHEILLLNKEAYRTVLHFTWVNPEGWVTASTRQGMIGLSISDRAFFQDIVSGRDKVVSELLESKSTGGPIFTVSRGIRDRKGTLLSIVVAAVEPDRLDETLSVSRASGGTITLIDNQGKMVFRSPKVDLEWEDRDYLRRYPPLEKALKGEEFTAALLSHIEGRRRMVAFCPIQSTGWVAAVGVAEEEAMAPALEDIEYHMAISSLAMLAAFAGVMVLFRRLLSPIQNLREQALLLGRGELGRPVETSGPIEIEDLACSFNVMAERVRAREDSLLEIQNELESRVLERTAALSLANEALRESEARYRGLVESQLDFITRTDLNGKVLFVNEAQCLALGKSCHELIGRTFHELVYAEDGPRAAAALLTVLDVPHRTTVETRSWSIRGLRWFHWEVAGILNPKGEVVEIQGVGRDITERKQAEEVLENRLVALTQPTVELGELKLTDIIGVGTLQKIQDGFSEFYGIPSAILDPQGTPITEERSFAAFCRLVRSSPKGYERCMDYYRMVGDLALRGISLIRQGCMVKGIMRGAIPIVIQGRHVATWAMGQVLDSEADEEEIRKYAREMGIAEEELVQASRELVRIPAEKFEGAAKFLDLLARQVSLMGLQNLQQARLINERRQAEKALTASERRLRFLSSRLLSAQEEERRRISRELHDSLGSSLAAIKISLENIRRRMEGGEIIPETLDIPIAWTSHAMEEARRMMMDLRPSLLDDLGVVATIDWFCKQMRSIYPGRCIETDVRIEEEHVPQELKVIIFRVLQEALYNTAKHSGAEVVKLSLMKAEGRVVLSVQDDGLGFDAEGVNFKMNGKGGLGLTSMRERVELSGGTFFLESNPGQGTTVRASWPCPV